MTQTLTETAFERVRSALELKGKKVTNASDTKFVAQCPAHEDLTPSLSVTRRDDRTLLNCHSGCESRDIVDALGLTMADLFDNQRGADYEYRDLSGSPLRVVHRRYDATGRKQFRQTVTDSSTNVLFNVAEVAEAVAGGRPVWITEGEEDALTARAMGVVATTAPQGASNFDKVDTTPLAGAHVFVVIDRDDAGRKHAAQVAATVGPIAASLRFYEAAEGKDLTDHYAAGRRLDELLPLEITTPQLEPNKPQARIKVRRASEIAIRAVRWLWHLVMPLGEIVLVAGREGIGKSTFLYWIMARITRGEVEGEYAGQPRPVIIVATEDSWEATIVPRLMAEGADLDLVYQVESVELLDDDGSPIGEAPILLPRDLTQLRELIFDTGAAAVLLDPLMSRMGDALDTHVDRDVRTALEPLAKIAHETNTTILGIIHMNKGATGDVLNSVMGSRAFTAVARAVVVAMRDPEDESSRLVGIAKSNLGPDDLPAWRYQIAQAEVGREADGRPITAAQYVDHGRHSVSIRDAGKQAAGIATQVKREQQTVTGRCEAWLRNTLDEAYPEPLLRSDIITGAHVEGFSESIVKRAALAIGVEYPKYKAGGPGYFRKPDRGWKGVHELRARGDSIHALVAPVATQGAFDDLATPQVKANALNQSVSIQSPRVREDNKETTP